MDWREELEGVGRLFYVVSPNRTTFSEIDDVPYYEEESHRHLAALIFLELLVSALFRGVKPCIRVNDTIANLSTALLLQLSTLLAPGGQLALYTYVHSNWKVLDMPWDCLFTWWFGLLAIDFLYYWLHRAAHEINILWVMHEAHHSSEDYNLTVNLRQSLVQSFALWPVFVVLYLPLAVVLPPTVFLVHFEFNQLYQHWIHTEVIRTLGPLEHLLITPSHHRVHHGSNKNFIDKNFGGTFVVWDKLFGTFASETERVIYGLTEPAHTFEPLSVTFSGVVRLFRRFWLTKGWKNKLWVLLKGPGWAPGKPRLGDPADITQKKLPTEKYDPRLLMWEKVYAVCHFFLIFQANVTLTEKYEALSAVEFAAGASYIVISLVSVGMILDRRACSPMLEVCRCVLFFTIDYIQRGSEPTLSSLHARWVPEDVVRATLAASLAAQLLKSGQTARHKID